MGDTDSSLELWLVDLEDCAGALEASERAQPRLADDDLERAEAISDLRERRHRLAAYSALRVLLERVAGPSVRAAPFTRTPGAKPRLTGTPIDFSLSHTDRFALIGVSASPPVGVDLERLRPVKMVPQRLSEIMALGVALGQEALPGGDKDRAFLQAWARLEAFSKARGVGLAQTLQDLGARGSPRQRPSLLDLRAQALRVAFEAGLTVHDIRLPLDLVGAVAGAPGVGPSRARQFPTDRRAIEQLIG